MTHPTHKQADMATDDTRIAEITATCELCGEPMPPGEEMFMYHGYSGPCPKPALKQPEKIFVEYVCRDSADGSFCLDVIVNGQPYNTVGCLTPRERKRVLADLMDMMRQLGAKDGASA